MAAKPSSVIGWTATGVAPTSGKKAGGWKSRERPPASAFNWKWKLDSEWMAYLNDGAFTGAFSFASLLSPSAITGTVNDWAPTNFATAQVIRVDTSAEATLTGIAAGTVGRVIKLINISANVLNLAHDVTSTAANRFYCPNNVDLPIGQNVAVDLIYDSTSSRWRVIATCGNHGNRVRSPALYLGRGNAVTAIAQSSFIEFSAAADSQVGWLLLTMNAGERLKSVALEYDFTTAGTVGAIAHDLRQNTTGSSFNSLGTVSTSGGTDQVVTITPASPHVVVAGSSYAIQLAVGASWDRVCDLVSVDVTYDNPFG